MNKLLVAFLFLTLVLFQVQASKVDSFYKGKIRNASNDTVKINLLFEWDDKIYIEYHDLDIQLNSEIISICRSHLEVKTNKKEHLFYASSLARALNNKGLALSEKNKLNEALELLNESYQLAKKYKFKQTESHCTNNIGTIYRTLNEQKKAIQFYQKSLSIIKDSAGTPETFNNIALCYGDLGDTTKALLYYNISLRFSENSDHKLNYANTLLNLADIYFKRKDIEKASYYFKKALKQNLELNNLHGIGYCYFKLSNLFLAQKNYIKAIEYGQLALKIGKENELLFIMKEAALALYKTYKEQNDLKNALKYYEIHNDYLDEFTRQNNREELIKKEYYFEYKNKEKISETKHKKQLELAAEKNKQQKTILIFVIIFFLGLLVFLYYIVKSFRRTKKMNSIIQLQKKEVEQKNREILDSISYAKRIQKAILPADELFSSVFKESFILYLPKDIVAGDFYWLEQVGTKILLAVADCTGHGVPGAMVSVVCNNALNRCIREFKLTRPDEILNKTRQIVIEEFEKSKEEVKDGMDISLCCIDLEQENITWAGANNPLIIVRNQEIIEFKGDKQPIGNYHFLKDFTLHEFNLQKRDSIFLFSDGYVDQFGGDSQKYLSGKKFKSMHLKKLLLSISDLEINEQKHILEREFLKWKGKLEQVDDICIVGLKI